eukprot:g2256.t1
MAGNSLPVPSLRSFELLKGDTLPSHSVLVFHGETPDLPAGGRGAAEPRENAAPFQSYDSIREGAGAPGARRVDSKGDHYHQDFQAYRHQQYAEQQMIAAFDDGFDEFDDFEALEKELDEGGASTGFASKPPVKHQDIEHPQRQPSTSVQDADFFKIVQSSNRSDINNDANQQKLVSHPSPQAQIPTNQPQPGRRGEGGRGRTENIVNDEMRKSREERRQRYNNRQQQQQQNRQPAQTSKLVQQRFGNPKTRKGFNGNVSTRQAAEDYTAKKSAADMEIEIESRVTKLVSTKVKRLEEEIARYKAETAKLRSTKVKLEVSMQKLKEERAAFEARVASADKDHAAKAAKDRERLKKERRVMERQVRAQLHMPNRKDRMEMEALKATIAKMKVTAQKKEGRWKVTERRMQDRVDSLNERITELESSLKFSHAGQQQQQRRIEQLEREAEERSDMDKLHHNRKDSGVSAVGEGKGDIVMDNYELLKEMYPDSNDVVLDAATINHNQDKEDTDGATARQESLRQQYLEQQALMRLKRLQQKGQEEERAAQEHEAATDTALSEHHKAVVLEQNQKVAVFHSSIEKEMAAVKRSSRGRHPYNPDAYNNTNYDDEDEETQDRFIEVEESSIPLGEEDESRNGPEEVTTALDYSSVGNNSGVAGLRKSRSHALDQVDSVISQEKVSFYANTLRASYGEMQMHDNGKDNLAADKSENFNVTKADEEPLENHRDDVLVENEDPGQLIVYEDGKRERRYKNGRRQLWFRNGTEKDIAADGSATVRFANGDIKKTHSDTGLVVYFYASANTTHTTYGNGVEIFEFPNGQLSIFPDGKMLRETKDGKIISSDV